MAGASVKMGVDVTQFKQGLREAQASVKTLDAELKKNEAQFKATGDKETYMTQKSKLLKQELEQQKTAAKNAEQALKAMADSGVSKTSEAYQRMAQQLAGAQAAMYNTEAALNNLSVSEAKAAGGAKNLTDSVNSIGKKISLDQVIGGIDKITTGLENAAKKAVELGKEIWNNIMDSAQWSDDTATQAMILDMSVEQYQQYKGVFDTIGELSVRDWMTAKRKVEKAITDPSNDQIDVLKALGFVHTESGKYGPVEVSSLADNWEQAFWDAAKALRGKVENGEISQEMADVYGEALFGKKYSNMKPLMSLGQEGFEAALKNQIVASEEAIQKNAALNDAVIKLQNSYDALKAEVTSGLAPALTSAAEALDGLLGKLMEYLQKPEGQAMLERLGTAVSGLFEDIGNIDPQEVVSGFVGVFEQIIGGLDWLVENKDTVVTAMGAIVTGWGLLQLADGALDILKLVQGIQGLSGGSSAARKAGEAAGSAWGAGLAAGIMKAAPWIIGLINLLTPSETANDDEFYNGKITQTGRQNLANSILTGEFLSGETSSGWGGWGEVGTWLANNVDSSSWNDILNSEAALNALARYFKGSKDERGTEAELISTLKLLGFVLKDMSEPGPDEHPAYVPGSEAGTYTNSEAGIYNLHNERVGTDVQKLLGAPGGVVNPRGRKGIPVTVDPEVEAGSDDSIAQQIGTVTVPLAFSLPAMSFLNGLGMGWGQHANGLFSVPWDGYPAILHKGERVVPERAANYNSNIYFGNVNLNNGLEIEALTESIDRRNRRQRSGYGS